MQSPEILKVSALQVSGFRKPSFIWLGNNPKSFGGYLNEQ
jgi:hypothetical protein